MILFPAVDIKGGQAVRLRRGRADDSTVFSDDPVAAALQWQEQGAKFLHLVDLDGAFEGVSPNTDLVRRICEALSIPVQLGGGIRDEETAHRWLDAGVARLIIGTLALEDPARFAALCHACPGRIGVSLDAENGRLKTRGWVSEPKLPSLFHIVFAKRLRTARGPIPHGLGGGLGHSLGCLAARRHLVTGTRAVDAA